MNYSLLVHSFNRCLLSICYVIQARRWGSTTNKNYYFPGSHGAYILLGGTDINQIITQ